MGYIPLVVAWAAIFGPATAGLAWRRRRNLMLWLLYGALLGPIALGILWIAPPGTCSWCETPTVGWLVVCDLCGLAVRLGPDRVRPVRLPASTSAVASSQASQASVASARRAIPGASGSPSRVPGSSGVPPEVGNPLQHPTTQPSDIDAVVMLASGIYLGGTEPLLPGAFYILTRRGTRLQVLGPLHVSPDRLQVEAPLADLEVSAFNGRLLINAREPTSRRFVLAFQTPAGASAEQLTSAAATARTVVDEPGGGVLAS